MSQGETYAHDVCPVCGTASKPAEGVPDQFLRSCPECLEEWWEDPDQAPTTEPRKRGQE
jgi:hypothetical protein